MKEQFEEIQGALLVRAPAKINLALLIAGKRDDGFHEIETVMAKIDLYDELLFEQNSARGIELVCRGEYEVRCDEDNLVYRACRLLCNQAGHDVDVRITLTKNIPVGAGLGGGSSDAAAALLGLNRYAKLGISTEKLSQLAAQLGSDISFFLGGPVAFCTGRGEKIKKISEKISFRAILILPDISVSTREVYVNYVHDESLYRAQKIILNEALQKKNVASLPKMCANMLEGSSFGLHKELADLKSRVESLGIGKVCLSGSGSTLFVVAGTEEDIERSQSILQSSIGCKSLIVNSNRW